MKKPLSVVLGTVASAALVLFNVAAFPACTTAAEYTYSGTVTDQTTSDMLYLKTSGGTIQIKLDSSTETENAKFLLPGNSLTAKCYTGSDEYWHASKLTGSSSAGKVNVDSSNKSTVKGTIAKGTSEELLYLVTNAGTMQIKLDTDTDVSGVKYMIIGKSVQVVCARGSDAYMHALSISDVGGSSGSSTSGLTVSGSSVSGVSGTVEKGTTSSLLCLSTSGGTMQIVLDLGTDASGCRVLIPGQSVTVNFYRGSDAWNHSSKIVNNSSSAASVVSLDGNSRVTVSGKVSGDTTENTLFLSTSGGDMQIRLDSNTNFSRCPVLLLDKSVQVVAERGSDEYYHAVEVIAN